ncbi:MAG TPA: ABC transporter permease [Ilumatobacteraceae bacterium]|nr:ABC transporter permease [Ilumatobacteraceae bacterium]
MTRAEARGDRARRADTGARRRAERRQRTVPPLGVISLVVGAIGIANVTLVTVMERTGEIGLRRALGARHRHIAGQVLCESAAIGVIGGIVGASAGIVTVVVSASRDWTPLLDPWLPSAAPPAGALVGLLAGAYPAIRAARMEPVEALRSAL